MLVTYPLTPPTLHVYECQKWEQPCSTHDWFVMMSSKRPHPDRNHRDKIIMSAAYFKGMPVYICDIKNFAFSRSKDDYVQDLFKISND